MPDNKELTPAEVYARLTRRVAYLSKFAWVMRFALATCALAFFVSLYTGELRMAIAFLFGALVTLIVVAQQNEHKLLLKLLPKPEGHSTGESS